jgi:predicted nuclease of predicted toxin-antitoxin system
VRFLLDEDVDARVVGVLVSGGHEAWSVVEAGLSSVNDEIVAIYGHTKRAAVLTHDKEFSRWRKRNCIGQHVFLKCEEPDARDLIEAHMDDLVEILDRFDDVYCELSQSGLSIVWQWK